MRNFIQLLTILIFLNGCRLISPSAVPFDVPEASLNEAQSLASQHLYFHAVDQLADQWWTFFADAQLNNLIDQAVSKNPTISIVESKILRAYYLAQEARSLLFPSLSFNANVQRQTLSKTTIPPFLSMSNEAAAAPIAPPPFSFTQYQLYLNLLYDFDLWGKNCNIYRAAVDELRAQMAEAAFVRLALSISVAEAYFAWQENSRHLAVIDQLISVQNRLVGLMDLRLKHNLANSFDLITVKKDLAGYEATRIQIATELVLREHQLQAYLADGFDEEFLPVSLQMAASQPIPLPRCIALNLIAKRPDITAQLWLIESFRRYKNIAEAEFYPNINLTAMLGYNTLHFKELLKRKSGFSLVEPALGLPLFTGGFLQAQYNVSVVDLDLAVYEYNQLILKAVEEVLNGIDTVRLAHEHLEYTSQVVVYEEENYALAQAKMANALANELELMARKQTLLIAQERQIEALGLSLQAVLRLVLALGGGYDCAS